jgi:hypothetical protein
MKVRRGKHSLLWAKEVFDYLNAVDGKPELQLFRARFGSVSTLYVVADFPDLATLEAWQKRIGADQGYRALIRQGIDIVIEGSIEDRVFESL